jgi:hypothetical protein
MFAILALLSTAIINPASAGTEGHGGGAFICPDPSQSEFYDLWEAENPQFNKADTLPALNIARSNDPVETQVQNAFNRFKVSPFIYNAILSVYADVKNAKRIPLPAGVDLSWPVDENNQYIKSGCSAKAVILYHDDADTDDTLPFDAYGLRHGNDSMDFDSNALSSLPPTDQAAAWVHETIYRFARETLFSKDSVSAQLAVGLLFSNQQDSYVIDQIHHLLHLNFSNNYGLKSVSQDQDGYDTDVNIVVPYYTARIELQFKSIFHSAASDSRCLNFAQLYGGVDTITDDTVFLQYIYVNGSSQMSDTYSGQDISKFYGQKSAFGQNLICSQQTTVLDVASGKALTFYQTNSKDEYYSVPRAFVQVDTSFN